MKIYKPNKTGRGCGKLIVSRKAYLDALQSRVSEEEREELEHNEDQPGSVCRWCVCRCEEP